ncbi:uncharacterized protein LY79DRAFT_517041 [Colletotrichum navitas]|uniref:Nucleic acid-binding protein n=1 Tax=Colletotrichum navitas TaxID=681940 RepID=A0AAD8PX75_9PEZI|nr:uncharacterized protein LY79DRAFT_517041 [Colletotrichum navitas]KAK1589751.1 hypothetical protein LY79DRAFT_517041 [Colletotrichum navitas]
MPRVIIFTGAPEADWSSPDLLIPPSASASASAPAPISHSTSTPPAAPPAWRSLPLHRRPLVTGFSQPHGLPSDFLPPAHFFSLSLDADSQQDTTTAGASQELLSQFYDHSLALHHSLASSQLPPPLTPSHPDTPAAAGIRRVLPPSTAEQHTVSFDETTATESFVSETTDSFQDTTAAAADLTSSGARPPPVTAPPHHHLSDLKDIPAGPDLLRLAPQTVTVNLIAGVISVSEPRGVTTRWGNELSLVEVLIGDDTRAGFGVTFWLPSSGGGGRDRDEEGTTPMRLRRQDVVLLQNVALHVFRGKVYGQSLRKGLTRTTVLYRRKLGDDDDDDEEGEYYRRRDLEAGGGDGAHPQLVKTKRVWEWVLRFVGGEERTGTKGNKRRGWDAPPDDTQ